ncbi:MAG TPA: hypothetical protein VKV40_12520 [Ktedonobacteraceae bacterium]|nr:hypothetical protein [Ktedonobacteraceae bacterium]
MAQQPGADDTEEVVVPGVASIVGILMTGLLYLVLPANVTIGPNWLLLLIEGIFVVPLLIDILTVVDLPHTFRRILVLVPLSASTVALIVSVALFVLTLAANTNANNLLRGGALLWVFNILVFALWYWEVDGGGPIKRHLSGLIPTDFLFPQQTNDFPQPANSRRWEPHFLDYLFLAFTSATALSPADTYPLTRAAKTLMMMEGLISLVVAALLVARAVNILGK